MMYVNNLKFLFKIILSRIVQHEKKIILFKNGHLTPSTSRVFQGNNDFTVFKRLQFALLGIKHDTLDLLCKLLIARDVLLEWAARLCIDLSSGKVSGGLLSFASDCV